MNIKPFLLGAIIGVVAGTIIIDRNDIALQLALFAIPFILGLIFICIVFSEDIGHNIQTEYTDRVIFAGKQK